jgi:hypothetical protein
VLAHWNYSPRIDMSRHSDILFCFWANQSLLFLLNAACLAEKQQIPIIWSSIKFYIAFFNLFFKQKLIDNKPCLNPAEATDEQLKQELLERGKLTTGTREQMITRLTTPDNSKILTELFSLIFFI